VAQVFTNNFWKMLCEEAVKHPSILSEHWLNLALAHTEGEDRTQVEGWIRVWDSHQASREVHQLYHRYLHEQHQFPYLVKAAQVGTPDWLADGKWFALGCVVGISSNASDGLILAQPGLAVQKRAQEIVEGRGGENSVHIPSY